MVFIPAYICEAQIGRVVRGLDRLVDEPASFAIVCIENRSTDKTLECAESALEACAVREKLLIRNDENYNLGGSHKVAFELARVERYDYVVVLHGDDQGSIADLLPLIRASRHKQVDALLGARFMKDSKLVGYSALRTVANVFFNALFSLVAGKRLYDLGSGLNLFRREIFDEGFHLRYSDTLTFNYYLILGMSARENRVEFFPINWREDDQVSNAKLFSQGLTMLKMLTQRVMSKSRFLQAEHRAVPRSSYPATVVRRWPTESSSS